MAKSDGRGMSRDSPLVGPEHDSSVKLAFRRADGRGTRPGAHCAPGESAHVDSSPHIVGELSLRGRIISHSPRGDIHASRPETRDTAPLWEWTRAPRRRIFYLLYLLFLVLHLIDLL